MKDKTILKWLEKVFVKEIDHALNEKENVLAELPNLAQLPKKQAAELIDLGLVEELVVRDGIFVFIFHVLTLRGNIKYCESCKKPGKGT